MGACDDSGIGRYRCQWPGYGKRSDWGSDTYFDSDRFKNWLPELFSNDFSNLDSSV
jgi:hypothetical protein